MSRGSVNRGNVWGRKEQCEDAIIEAIEPTPPQLGPDVSQAWKRSAIRRLRGAKGRSLKKKRLSLIAAVFAKDYQPGSPELEVRLGSKIAKANRIARVGCKCEACETAMPVPRLVHLHHVVFVSRGGSNADENTILLCPNCHSKAHWLDTQIPADERPRNSTELLLLLRPSP